jgi:hypothetical protein
MTFEEFIALLVEPAPPASEDQIEAFEAEIEA